MSKTISLHSLTMLRKKIRDGGENYLNKDKLNDKEFGFENIEFISAPEYPVLDKGFIDEFYSIYQNNPKNEFLLAKHLHENIKIDRKLAANNLYWVYLNLNHFFDYIKNRWLSSKNGDELGESDIDRYFLALEPSQNSLIKSPIAGLWWAIELTIDENLEHKYHYSKVFLSDRNLRNKNLGTYQLIRNKHVLQASLDFYATFKDAVHNGNRIGSEAIAQQMSKTLNQIGGLTLLGYLSKQEVFEILFKNKEIIFDRAYSVKKGKVISRKKISNIQKDLWNQEHEESDLVNDSKYYFILDRDSGAYKLETKLDKSFDENILLNINNDKCFLVHVYQEGKIKKSNLGDLKNKIQKGQYDKNRLFKNGINNKLHLNKIIKIEDDSLFCLAYKINKKVFVKLLDAQDEKIFRSDNTSLRQEGKKVIYANNIEKLLFKSISYDYKSKLNRLVCSSTARGVLYKNPNYANEWSILRKIWPELFISF